MAEPLFKIIFVNQSRVYEVYARQVQQSSLFGFIEIEEFVFGDNSTLVIDPGEERLRDEFGVVKRSYIPMHAVVRIDEVEKRGTAKIVAFEGKAEDVYRFPASATHTPKPANKD
ncbi:DUF1820 family protein [Sulfuriflexus sp.]|uniref:DUF1820 family protein n=1 Tax=Sulfuriflexus sp. TaxID=2015443 RepID=UPI0028CE77F0|nr:DUF1820 family protein [Sulfuriflexus sp.]MDT8405020.1 DUF1820 family protein [Sulfuriflexus sp.]